MICENCGARFDAEDRGHYTEAHGEVFACCPNCGSSDISDSERCAICGEEFDEEELREGFCLECLWNAIDYDTALAFMQYDDSLTDFMLSEWLGAGSISASSYDLDKLLLEIYQKNAEQEKAAAPFSDVHPFLQACRTHCLPYYPKDWGMEGRDFAEWYAEHRKEEEDG